MKRFISVIVLLVMVIILIGCSGMTAEQRKDTYDLRENVGSRQFVGETSPEARNLAYVQMYGH